MRYHRQAQFPALHNPTFFPLLSLTMLMGKQKQSKYNICVYIHNICTRYVYVYIHNIYMDYICNTHICTHAHTHTYGLISSASSLDAQINWAPVLLVSLLSPWLVPSYPPWGLFQTFPINLTHFQNLPSSPHSLSPATLSPNVSTLLPSRLSTHHHGLKTSLPLWAAPPAPRGSQTWFHPPPPSLHLPGLSSHLVFIL